MYLNSNINFFKSNFFNFLLGLMPFSFIAGNMIININLILIILLGIVIYNKKLFIEKYYLIDKLIISFFVLIIFTSFFNDIFVFNKLFWVTKFSTTLRSFLFLKYLLLYFVLKYLIENDIIKLKL